MSIPARLGKYDILRELGQGAMGIVYEGRDPVIDRRVAIKTLKREQLERSEADEVIARFKREAQAAGRLNHPNVVAIYEYGEEADGTAFIAMEFVQGRELKDAFDSDERIPLQMVGRVMDQLLDALEHAHRNGVTHRDIKPANIILLADGTVKVADFGVSHIESPNLPQAGPVPPGTPPERVRLQVTAGGEYLLRGQLLDARALPMALAREAGRRPQPVLEIAANADADYQAKADAMAW